MANVEARIKIGGKHFEIMVDLDEALNVKAGTGDITIALQSQQIFTDLKKGNIAAQEDLKTAFGTTEAYEVAKQIISKGEVQKTQEHRDAEKEKRINQVVSLIVRNATDPAGRPFTEGRIRSALAEVHINIDNRPAEQQMQNIIHKLKGLLPISIKVKRVKITIPARYTGQAYGLFKDYEKSEEWLSNGDLQATLAVPAGLLLDFYEDLNSVTHGAVQSEEIAE